MDDGRTAIEKLETSSDNIFNDEDIFDYKGWVQIKEKLINVALLNFHHYFYFT